MEYQAAQLLGRLVEGSFCRISARIFADAVQVIYLQLFQRFYHFVADLIDRMFLICSIIQRSNKPTFQSILLCMVILMLRNIWWHVSDKSICISNDLPPGITIRFT